MATQGGPERESAPARVVGEWLVPQDGTSPEHLERVIRGIADIPVFPAAGLKLLAAFKNPYYTGKQLGEIIAGDVGLSARVLRMANSAYYSIQNKVTSVNHAVSLLGVREVEQMTLNLCFMAVSPQDRGDNEEFGPASYVRHSMVAAKVGQYLAGEIVFQLVGKGEAYAAGLLHDVGLILLFRNRRAALQESLQMAREKGLGYAKAELAVLHVSHAALGAWLAQQWNLPRSLCEAIAYHHCTPPQNAIQPELIALLKLSEKLAERLSAANVTETTEEEPLDASTLHYLADRGLPNDPRELVETVWTRHQKQLEKLGAEVEAMLAATTETPQRRAIGDLDRAAGKQAPPAGPTPAKPESGMAKLRRWFGR